MKTPECAPSAFSEWFKEPIQFAPRTVPYKNKSITIQKPPIYYIEKYRYCMIYVTFNEKLGKWGAMIDVVEQPYKNTTLQCPGVAMQKNVADVLLNARVRVDNSIRKAQRQDVATGIPISQIPGGLPETNVASQDSAPTLFTSEIYGDFFIEVYHQNLYVGSMYAFAESELYRDCCIVVSDGYDLELLLSDIKFKIDWYTKLSVVNPQ